MSSSDVAIRVDGLGKRYWLTQSRAPYRTLRESITGLLAAPLRRGRAPAAAAEEHWALKDVSFCVGRGEVVGVIGRNGAGKSTLLKILSRITSPSSGAVEVTGRVGSLLEVGTGFHPELSGRENIYLNGAILGMPRRDIARRFDEIVAFAEVERFLDTPVKRYSSGMYMRLAFAVAAHLEPDVLVVDEVLAVGDAAFQAKCLGKMGETARGGRTVLFVSHNMQAVSALTRRSILLSRGRCVADGPSIDVIAAYLREGQDQRAEYRAAASADAPRVTAVRVGTNGPAGVQVNGEPMTVEFEIATPRRIGGACLSFQVMDSLGRPVMHLWTFDSERPVCRAPGRYRLACRIPKLRLYLGQYTLTVHFTEGPNGQRFETLEQICPFEVAMFGRHREFEWQPGTCTYLEDCDWDVGPADEP